MFLLKNLQNKHETRLVQENAIFPDLAAHLFNYQLNSFIDFFEKMNSYWHFYNYWSLLLFMKIIVKAHLPHRTPLRPGRCISMMRANILQNTGFHFSSAQPL